MRISGDGNSFFRSLAYAVKGSQNNHHELHFLITTLMSQNPSVLACYLKDNETMNDYLRRTMMETLSIWASEVRFFAAAHLLQTPVFGNAKCGMQYTWLQYGHTNAAEQLTCKRGNICGKYNESLPEL